MKPWAGLPVGLAAFLLAGCYESHGLLLDAAAARQPIGNFRDWTDTRGGITYHERLTPRPDGWYDFEEAQIKTDGGEGAWDKRKVLLNDLGESRGVALYAYATWDEAENAYVYGLVANGPDHWRVVTPDCGSDGSETPDLHIALMAGGTDVAGVCDFADRESLLKALRLFAASPAFWRAFNAP